MSAAPIRNLNLADCPRRKIYKALGMTLRTNDAGPACTRPEYQTRGALKGTLIAMKVSVAA